MRRAVLLVALTLLPLLPAPVGTADGEVARVLHDVRATRTGNDTLRPLEGAAPRILSMVPEPVVRGGWVVLAYMGHNRGDADFVGVMRVRSEALGLDESLPYRLGADWFILGDVFVDARDFQGGAFDLALTLEDERGVVERWSRRLAVAESHPCDGRAGLVGSGGMRDVLPTDAPRYALMLCNGTDAPVSATVLLHDAATGRPLVGAISLAGIAYGAGFSVVRGGEASTAPYRWDVAPGWVMTMHYVLEEVPGVAELRPEATLAWDDGRVERVTDLDVVTFTLGEDLGVQRFPRVE